ncbi:MAG: RagB/SusD family nutrient uptake outer membrane protein [Gemmatimonadaceae bacterium]
MTRHAIAAGFRRHPGLMGWGAAALVLLGGCRINDTLLEAKDPDIINPSDVQSAEGATGLANGALGTFRSITAGSESTWLFGGLLADEWSTSSTFIQNDETDQRMIQENNSSITGMLRRLYQTRTRTTEAVKLLEEYRPTAKTLMGELYFARGFAEMQLAQDFCNGIPLGDPLAEPPENGAPKSVAEVFTTALASYDAALALVPGTDAASVAIARAVKIGRARAMVSLGLNNLDAAAALVAGIPTSFAYQHTFANTTTGSNTIWAQGLSARRYAVSDTVEGNTRNIRVANALPFGSAKDPRLPVTDPTSVNGQDGQTRARTTTLYAQFTPVDVVNGIDARLIEAEAALRKGDPAWLTILNGLRASPPKVGNIQPAAMPALTDPGTADARLDLFFREKAFWTFSRGQRLNDLRRLIRQYGRTAANTFPQGSHFKGGNYGTDVNLPIVTDERNNPNFKGCTDRNA